MRNTLKPGNSFIPAFVVDNYMTCRSKQIVLCEISGLTLNGYPRTTEDIDLIVKSDVLDKIKDGILELGHEYTTGEDRWGITIIKKYTHLPSFFS